jgi:hypothetical protein
MGRFLFFMMSHAALICSSSPDFFIIDEGPRLPGQGTEDAQQGIVLAEAKDPG